MSTTRIERLAGALRSEGVDAFFATSTYAMGYLQGVYEGGGERLLTLAIRSDGSSCMICPALSAEQGARCGVRDIRSWRDGEDPFELVHGLATEWELKSAVIAVDDTMSAAILLGMQSTLPAALFKPGGELLGSLTSVKEQSEIEILRRAGKIADDAFEAVKGRIKAGMKETDVSELLEQEMRRLGGVPMFAIVATGANGAEPHHLTDSSVLREGDVLIMDFGCVLEGYHSDITRTVSVGRASVEAKKIYGLVFAAHMSARHAIRRGASGQDVDRAARNVIADGGYGQYFNHRTGHGIGMQVHEPPYIVEGNSKPLVAGNTFSIEPGIYLPGKFGVRIENIVVATEDGHESMNAEPSPNLIELV